MRRNRFQTAHGSRIYIEEARQDLPMLALPGLGGGAYFFRSLAAPLATRCRLVAIDLPGTGASTSTPVLFSLGTWIDDLTDLVASFGQPAVLLSHSLETIL